MFIGATLLELGYQVFTGWVAANPDSPAPPATSHANDAM
jgi:hypothetical protein